MRGSGDFRSKSINTCVTSTTPNTLVSNSSLKTPISVSVAVCGNARVVDQHIQYVSSPAYFGAGSGNRSLIGYVQLNGFDLIEAFRVQLRHSPLAIFQVAAAQIHVMK